MTALRGVILQTLKHLISHLEKHGLCCVSAISHHPQWLRYQNQECAICLHMMALSHVSIGGNYLLRLLDFGANNQEATS